MPNIYLLFKSYFPGTETRTPDRLTVGEVLKKYRR